MAPNEILGWLVFVGLLAYMLGYACASNARRDYTDFVLRRNLELAEENERLKLKLGANWASASEDKDYS